MSKHYEKVKGYYDKNLWSKTRVYNAVGKWITAGEYEEITGETYEKQTENYGFNVPEEHEFYGVAAQNENWEKLDATLTQIESRLQEIAEAKQ